MSLVRHRQGRSSICFLTSSLLAHTDKYRGHPSSVMTSTLIELFHMAGSRPGVELIAHGLQNNSLSLAAQSLRIVASLFFIAI